jgi:hypothetical protein
MVARIRPSLVEVSPRLLADLAAGCFDFNRALAHAIFPRLQLFLGLPDVFVALGRDAGNERLLLEGLGSRLRPQCHPPKARRGSKLSGIKDFKCPPTMRCCSRPKRAGAPAARNAQAFWSSARGEGVAKKN